MLGGTFYNDAVAINVNQPNATLDPTTVADAMTRFQPLYDWDLAYCQAVEGAALESNLWVVRNKDKLHLSDADLVQFKNVAWNEVILKRFLPSQSTVAPGASLLDIVRQLNLTYHSVEVRGLHPKVEAAEKQIAMALMQRKLVPFSPDVDMVALRLRRSPTLSRFFANAVGCKVCALTGHTPGLSKTQYNADLDYVYKQEGMLFLVEALTRCRLETAPQIDYVAELSKLIFICAPTSTGGTGSISSSSSSSSSSNNNHMPALDDLVTRVEAVIMRQFVHNNDLQNTRFVQFIQEMNIWKTAFMYQLNDAFGNLNNMNVPLPGPVPPAAAAIPFVPPPPAIPGGPPPPAIPGGPPPPAIPVGPPPPAAAIHLGPAPMPPAAGIPFVPPAAAGIAVPPGDPGAAIAQPVGRGQQRPKPANVPEPAAPDPRLPAAFPPNLMRS